MCVCVYYCFVAFKSQRKNGSAFLDCPRAGAGSAFFFLLGASIFCRLPQQLPWAGWLAHRYSPGARSININGNYTLPLVFWWGWSKQLARMTRSVFCFFCCWVVWCVLPSWCDFFLLLSVWSFDVSSETS